MEKAIKAIQEFMTSTSKSREATIGRVMFFDNNFLNHLLHGNFMTQLSSLGSDLRSVMEPPFTPWRSPFALIELLGIKTQRLAKPSVFKPINSDAPDVVEKAYLHFKSHYDGIPDLHNAALRLRAENQRSTVVPELADFWNCYMAGMFSEYDEGEWIRTALAFDAMHGNKAPMQCKHYRSSLIAEGTVNTNEITANFSKMRLAYSFWKECLAKNLVGPKDCEQRRKFEEAQKLIRLDSHGDFLDCDIIHYATMGAVTREGARFSVTCVTSDLPEVVAMRLRIYKGLLAYIREVYSDDARMPCDFEDANNGTIICFDEAGQMIRVIDTQRDIQPLYFIR